MYRIATLQDRLGSGDYVVVVRVPVDRVPMLERCRLRRAGFADRLRSRVVSDDKHTHFIHIVERQVRRMEAEVSKRVDEGISRIDIRVAELDAILAEAAPALHPPVLTAVPHAAELADLQGRDRHEWASARRDARRAGNDARADASAAAGAAAAHASRAEAARIERSQLVVLRGGLIAEGEAVRRLWREAFVVRGAVYNRTRFGMFGPRPSEEPAVPEYEFAVGPTVQRDR